jgi:dolichyl-phosphate beta-glucosyltransferase
MSQPMLSVVIPAFNAARHIEDRLLFLSSALRRMELESEIIVVDDGSTDATWDIVERAGVRGIRLETNSGKFAAIKAGVREMHGRCCIFTDSDVPFDPSVMRLMVELTVDKGFHVAVGDRTLPASEYEQQGGLTRRIATRAFRDAVRLLVTGELPDTQCGIKGFRGDVAKVLFALLQEDRFAGDVELLYICLKYNLAIRRVPVRLIHQGSSSVRPFRDGVEMLTQIARLRRRYRRGAYESPELQRIVEDSMSHSGGVFR